MVGIGTSCGACKFLRRKCEDICIFAPYFSYDRAEVHFAAVHKVFGASNVSKLLSHLPLHHRCTAAITIAYEAQARIRDPIRGCVSHILALQQQVVSLQEEIDFLTMRLANGSNGVGRLSPRAMTGFFDGIQLCMQRDSGDCRSSSGHAERADGYESSGKPNLEEYKEAIDRLERCLFSDETSSWEELSLSALEEDLLY